MKFAEGRKIDTDGFDLERFLPYLLNQAAEATSRSFQEVYRTTYGMTRTQWRVLANLGRFGAMTARDICRISHIEKTKVSRAIAALERDNLVSRRESKTDRRAEILTLTPRGEERFAELGHRAIEHDRQVRARLGPDVAEQLASVLRMLIADAGKSQSGPDDAQDQ
ncbi:MAG: MarR family transcriptional regulator [Alphaproteobacteria bacterium]|nr:MAG: MarR family transcriptional regulator [Alphaproteobacteria bacterium]